MLLIFTLLSGLWANGLEHLKPLPSEVMAFEVVTFETLPAFHFELKAPQKCDGAAPLSATPRKILCRFADPGDHPVTLSICDNAKTFCKPENFSMKVTGKTKEKTSVKAVVPSENLKITQTELFEKTLPGFERVLLEALTKSNEKKPVFVMVGTDWCPPCNEAKEALLSTKGFQEATSDFVRVYVDGDSAIESNAWRPFVPFHGFPTFVLLNGDLKEVARYGGQLRLYDFKDWANQARENLKIPINDLVKVVRARQAGDFKQKWYDLFGGWADTKKDQDRLLAWAIAAEDKPSLSLFKRADVPSDLRGDWLRIEKQNDDLLSPEEKTYLKLSLLEASKDSENFTTDLQELCEESVPICKPWVEKLKNRKGFWDLQKFANPAEKAVALIEDYSVLSEIYSLVGNKENAIKAAEVCVQAAEELTKNSPLKLSRAAGIGESYCLDQVGRPKDAEKIYQQLMASYGTEPTFFLRYANFLKKQNRLKEALGWAEKATKAAYGYNWMKAVTLKVKIEIAMKDTTSAEQTIQSALRELDLSSSDPQSRDQRLAKTFRDLQSSLQLTQ